MATMIPGDIEEFETDRKKAFYKFLEGVAKPVGFVGTITSDWPATCAAERAI